MCGPLMLIYAEEDGDYRVADAHAHSAGEHDRFAAEFVDVEDLVNVSTVQSVVL